MNDATRIHVLCHYLAMERYFADRRDRASKRLMIALLPIIVFAGIVAWFTPWWINLPLTIAVGFGTGQWTSKPYREPKPDWIGNLAMSPPLEWLPTMLWPEP